MYKMDNKMMLRALYKGYICKRGSWIINESKVFEGFK